MSADVGPRTGAPWSRSVEDNDRGGVVYGEPKKIRDVAERLEFRAETLRVQARELHARSETAAWVSVAADRMRGRAAERRDELLAVADAYDEAGARVRDHADQVQRRLDLIASLERRARAIAGSLVDLPPPGHRGWLDLPDLLPGLR